MCRTPSGGRRTWGSTPRAGTGTTRVSPPASTPPQQLTDDELRTVGIGPELVRVSIGIEDLEDIVWDLEQALAASQKARPVTPAVADEGLGHSILSKAYGAPYQR